MVRHFVERATALAGPHGSSGAPIWELVKVTASSILEVIILSTVGYILARRGIIDKKTQTKINKLNVSFFTPALLFSKVAFSLNPRRLAELIIVPIGFVIITAVSAFAAWALSKLARLSKAQRNFALACSISPNSNSLPVALMQSLVLTVPQLHWEEEGEPEDTVDQMLGRALTYLVLFSTLGMFLRWSVGAKLLSTVEEAGSKHSTEIEGGDLDRYRDDPHQGETPRTARLIDYEDDTNSAQNASGRPRIRIREPSERQENGNDRPPPEPLTDGGRPPVRRSSSTRSGPPAWTRSFPNTPGSPTESRGESLLDEEEFAERRRDLENQNGNNGLSTASSVQRGAKAFLQSFIVRPALAVNAFMTAPLWAAVMSLIVALIGPLQAFIDSLEPLVGALQTAGACSIPLTMVVLGAYFVEEKQAVDSVQGGVQQQSSTTESSGHYAPRTASPIQSDDRDGDRQAWGTESSSTVANDSSGSLSWMKNPWSSADSNARSRSNSGTTPVASTGGSLNLTPQHRSPGANGRSTAIGAKDHKSSESRQETKTIAVSIAARMVITPLILIPALAWYAVATRYNVMDDPVMIVSACLIIGSPPALTLAQITSQKANGNPQFERLISKTIFAAYAFLAAPTTILLVLAALLIAEYDH
ncbi:unnamed protein product [Sympodiomycopsis kandeliae]